MWLSARPASTNNHHERLKTWTNRKLRGMSTKCLPNYLTWMRVWEWFGDGAKPENFVLSGLGLQQINTLREQSPLLRCLLWQQFLVFLVARAG